MALREVSVAVDVLNSGCVLIHSSLIHTSTPIKKIALVAKATRGMLSLKHLPDSPTENQRECYHTYSDTDSPHGECYLASDSGTRFI